MTKEEFGKWSEEFIAKHPEHEIFLKYLANWDGDNLWRWAKRCNLMKDWVKYSHTHGY